MNKFIAAFISPVIFFLFLNVYNIIVKLFNGTLADISFYVQGLWFYYILASILFLVIAIPFSLLIEKIKFGFRWLNYFLSGVIGGVIFVLFNSSFRPVPLAIDYNFIITYGLAGFSFYLSLVLIEYIQSKSLQKNKI